MSKEVALRPSADVQRASLLDIQLRHQAEMKSIGLIGKAFEAESVSDYQRQRMNELTRAVAHTATGTDGNGVVRQAVMICFITPYIGPDKQIRNNLAYANLAYVYPDGELELVSDFNESEVDDVRRMLKELEVEKDTKPIPDLNESLSSLRPNIG